MRTGEIVVTAVEEEHEGTIGGQPSRPMIRQQCMTRECSVRSPDVARLVVGKVRFSMIDRATCSDIAGVCDWSGQQEDITWRK
jgi:hypothetical protein